MSGFSLFSSAPEEAPSTSATTGGSSSSSSQKDEKGAKDLQKQPPTQEGQHQENEDLAAYALQVEAYMGQISHVEETYGDVSPEMALVLSRLCEMLKRHGKKDKTLALRNRVLDIERQLFDSRKQAIRTCINERLGQHLDGTRKKNALAAEVVQIVAEEKDKEDKLTTTKKVEGNLSASSSTSSVAASTSFSAEIRFMLERRLGDLAEAGEVVLGNSSSSSSSSPSRGGQGVAKTFEDLHDRILQIVENATGNTINSPANSPTSAKQGSPSSSVRSGHSRDRNDRLGLDDDDTLAILGPDSSPESSPEHLASKKIVAGDNNLEERGINADEGNEEAEEPSSWTQLTAPSSWCRPVIISIVALVETLEAQYRRQRQRTSAEIRELLRFGQDREGLESSTSSSGRSNTRAQDDTGLRLSRAIDKNSNLLDVVAGTTGFVSSLLLSTVQTSARVGVLTVADTTFSVGAAALDLAVPDSFFGKRIFGFLGRGLFSLSRNSVDYGLSLSGAVLEKVPVGTLVRGSVKTAAAVGDFFLDRMQDHKGKEASPTNGEPSTSSCSRAEEDANAKNGEPSSSSRGDSSPPKKTSTSPEIVDMTDLHLGISSSSRSDGFAGNSTSSSSGGGILSSIYGFVPWTRASEGDVELEEIGGEKEIVAENEKVLSSPKQPNNFTKDTEQVETANLHAVKTRPREGHAAKKDPTATSASSSAASPGTPCSSKKNSESSNTAAGRKESTSLAGPAEGESTATAASAASRAEEEREREQSSSPTNNTVLDWSIIAVPASVIDAAATVGSALVSSTTSAVTDGIVGVSDGIAGAAGSVSDGVYTAAGSVSTALNEVGAGILDGTNEIIEGTTGVLFGAAAGTPDENEDDDFRSADGDAADSEARLRDDGLEVPEEGEQLGPKRSSSSNARRGEVNNPSSSSSRPGSPEAQELVSLMNANLDEAENFLEFRKSKEIMSHLGRKSRETTGKEGETGKEVETLEDISLDD
ncbi:unnamed protein product [Amoebophrya sp. A25]|nr:unnamed protein product [Amoebophrya sp. A25]|eukprot:GSA25T00002840001.1